MSNIEKRATEGCRMISIRRDLTSSDLICLMDMTGAAPSDEILQALKTAYYAGFTAGYRQRSAESKSIA